MDQQRDIIEELPDFRGVIFDLDGTLVDLGVDWEALKEDLAEYCRKEKGETISFTPLDQKIHQTKREYGEGFFRELLERITVHELKEVGYRLNEPLIEYIKKAEGQRLAIYTMNTEKCAANFRDRYLDKKEISLISKDACLEPKPTGKDLEALLGEWGIAPQEAIFIGNTENDRLSGAAAGIRTHIISPF